MLIITELCNTVSELIYVKLGSIGKTTGFSKGGELGLVSNLLHFNITDTDKNIVTQTHWQITVAYRKNRNITGSEVTGTQTTTTDFQMFTLL